VPKSTEREFKKKKELIQTYISCMRDEGKRPFGICFQESIPNHSHVAAVKSRGDERWRQSDEEIPLAGMDQRDECK
jgi:hypothetical protein